MGLAFLGLYTINIVSARHQGSVGRRQNSFQNYAILAMVVGAILLYGLGRAAPGFPEELVRVTNEAPLSLGYVLNVDDVSLTLAYRDGGIRRIPTDSVLERAVCPGVEEYNEIPPLLRTALRAKTPYIPPLCSYPYVRTQ
jgi:hypothetical protein